MSPKFLELQITSPKSFKDTKKFFVAYLETTKFFWELVGDVSETYRKHVGKFYYLEIFPSRLDVLIFLNTIKI